jgi:hypothetical protein
LFFKGGWWAWNLDVVAGKSTRGKDVFRVGIRYTKTLDFGNPIVCLAQKRDTDDAGKTTRGKDVFRVGIRYTKTLDFGNPIVCLAQKRDTDDAGKSTPARTSSMSASATPRRWQTISGQEHLPHRHPLHQDVGNSSRHPHRTNPVCLLSVRVAVVGTLGPAYADQRVKDCSSETIE